MAIAIGSSNQKQEKIRNDEEEIPRQGASGPPKKGDLTGTFLLRPALNQFVIMFGDRVPV
jgi:hypothetical protein